MSAYKKALEIVKSRRMNAIAENERRISEINRKIPQIAVLNATLFNTGRELIQLIAGGYSPDEIEKKTNQIKADNLQAQKMSRSFLKEAGYPENYLDTPFTCPYCNDTGYFHGYYCDCVKKLVAGLKAEQVNRNTQLKLADFSTFDLKYYDGSDRDKMYRISGYARNYAENFSLNSESLLFMGGVGLGKTHLSLCIAKEVINKGFNVVYDTAQNIVKSVNSEDFSYDKSADTQSAFMDLDLLIIDDLGTEYSNKNYTAVVFNIVNTRLNRGKPTIISTNLDFGSISERYGERTASRLIASYRSFAFCGKDIRLKKRLEQGNKLNPYR